MQCALCVISGICKYSLPPPIMLSSVRSAISHPQTPHYGQTKKECLAFLRVYPPTPSSCPCHTSAAPYQTWLNEAHASAQLLVLRWHSPPCFFFLFCVFSSRPNQSHPTICLTHFNLSLLLHFQSIRQTILTSREDLEQYW